MFAGLGAYAANFTTFDVGVILILGALGFFMRRHGFGIAPLVVDAILGPMAEEQLRKAMQLGPSDPAYLVQSPFTIVVLGFGTAVGGVFVAAAPAGRYERSLGEHSIHDQSA